MAPPDAVPNPVLPHPDQLIADVLLLEASELIFISKKEAE